MLYKYKAIGRISHNGAKYAIGEEIELTPEEANVLILVAAIDPTPLPGKPKVEQEQKKGKAKTSDDSLGSSEPPA